MDAVALPSSARSGGGGRGDVTLKLPQLQNLCKRDPAGHREDYDAQARRLRAECGVLASSDPVVAARRERGAGGDRLGENTRHGDLVALIQFVAAVSSSSYKGEETDRVSAFLLRTLSGRDDDPEEDDDAVFSRDASALPREVRRACVSALVLMRNKGAVGPLRLLRVFFRIMVTARDKQLSRTLYSHIVNDVRNVNKKGRRDDALNRSVRAFLHKVVAATARRRQNDALRRDDDDEDDDGGPDKTAARYAVDVVCDLYRRRVWTDDRTVSILESAARSPIPAVSIRAVRFFLNVEERMEHDRKSQSQEDSVRSETIDLHKHSVKTRKRRHRVQKDVANRHKARKQREIEDGYAEETTILTNDKGVDRAKKLYPAIELLRDPQGLAEHMLRRIKASRSSSVPFEDRLLMINFCTRLVGNHRLLLLDLYPLLKRYLGTHQRNVTALLAYTVQACHDEVPPEEVRGLLKVVAHNFITERRTGEEMAVGLNAARAVCARCPTALREDDDEVDATTTTTETDDFDPEAFARDLAGYAKHRDRSVAIAGRAWTNFVRETNPSLLQGKDRGATGAALHRAGEKPLRYGESRAAAGVRGADLLLEYEEKRRTRKQQRQTMDDEDDDEEEDEEPMKGDEEEEEEEEEEEHSSDVEEAPELVELDTAKDGDAVADVASMSEDERRAIQQRVSSTRVFSAKDFARMRRLVAREERARRDPREHARRKRASARGDDDDDDLDASSSSDDDDDDEPAARTTGAVDAADLEAEASRRRADKAERLGKIVAGRSKHETKARAGGATNAEKIRRKNFLMSKFSAATRRKQGDKGTRRDAKRRTPIKGSHQAKKRRRKT